MHNSEHHVSFTKNIGDIQMTRVGASMDDTVHVKVQMIEFRQQRRVWYNLIDFGVAFANPSVEL